MLLDLAGLESQARHDVVVVGSGPAGMTVALRLAERGRRVLLLEAGEHGPTEESQDVYRGEVIGDPYFELNYARLRCLGGTSGHWSGWCRPLDAIDFETRHGRPELAWPIRRADLDPYLPAAAEMLEISPEFPDEIISPLGIMRQVFNFSPPVFFAEKYGELLESSPNIDLCLRANLFRLIPEGGRIAALELRGYEGERVEIGVRQVVLACGGIENSRLLLHSNALSNDGAAPRSPTLGRYWMEHPHFTIGSALFFDGARPRAFFGLTDAAKADLGVLNCGLRLVRTRYRDRQKMIADLACVAPDMAEWASELLGQRLACGVKLRAAWEQAPRADNRVTLSQTETDAFGMPRSVLRWTKNEDDLRTVRETALRYGRFLAETDTGRVRLESWVLGDGAPPIDDELGGYHHMGGTRMAEGPETGVVDANLKVFGVDNLHVCGSSVFPSAGHANPTLTIVQLALRLGDHLAITG